MMEIEEIIEQLESLHDNSKSFIDPLEPGSQWHKDLWALEFAIALIKKTSQSANCKGQIKNTTTNYDYTTRKIKNKVKRVHLVSTEDIQDILRIINLAMKDIAENRLNVAFATLDRLKKNIENYTREEKL